MAEISGVGATPAGSTVPPMILRPEDDYSALKPIWQQGENKDVEKGVSVEHSTTPAAQKTEATKNNLVKATPHKIKKGFYPATSDANAAITGKKGILANDGEKVKKSSDPAGTVADAVLSTKSFVANNAQMQNQIRAMIIAANPSVFEKDGSLKKDKNGNVIADLGKLDIPTASYLQAHVSKADPKRTVIPKGFYPAFGDANSNINGLTESELRRNEGKEGNETNGAVQVLNALLKTKGATFMNSGEREAALLNDLVRRNPSVFDVNGKIKQDADLTKLDVPSLKYMEEAYGKLPYKSSKPVTIARTGYYAVGTGKDAKFYNARGQEVNPAEFAQKCPNIYRSIKTQ